MSLKLHLAVTLLLSSLAVVVNAEETPNQLLSALGRSTISGYIDTSTQWRPSTAPLPDDVLTFPIVFVTCRPKVFREGVTNRHGDERFLTFKVYRIGPATNECVVYLTFHGSMDGAVQASIHMGPGQRVGTVRLQISDDGIFTRPRSLTANISLDPVREGWARYRTSPRFPGSATALVINRRMRR